MVKKKHRILCYEFIVLFIVALFATATWGQDVKIRVSNAVLTSTTPDIGDAYNCFDGNPATLMRSANINPAFVQVAFPTQREVTKLRVLIGQPGYPNIDRDNWWVEAADTQEDLDRKTGSYQLVVPERFDVASTWDEVMLSQGVSKRIWRFWIRRTVSNGGDYVHIPELELWTSCTVFPGFELQVLSTDAMAVQLQWEPQVDANEYTVLRDGRAVGSTVAVVGMFTDFGLRPAESYEYIVRAQDESGVCFQSAPVTVTTNSSTSIRTHYNVLALAFNPGHESLVTEGTYLKHRIQFLKLASLGSAIIDLYKGGIVSSAYTPAVEPGTNFVDYVRLVTQRDLPGLDGYSIVDLVERGDIDHVWVVIDHSPVEFAENVLIGNRPIQGEGVTTDNTWVPIPVKCSRSFFVNSYSADERSYDAYAHMIEGIMTSVSDGHPESWPRAWQYTVYTTDRTSLATTQAWLNLWERFRLADEWNGVSPVAYASKGNGNCGSSHFPPNARRACPDYCYSEIETWRRYIDSVADDWLSFPDFNDIKRKLNGYDYGAFNNYAQGDPSYSAALGTSPEAHRSFQFGRASYHHWWFTHLPHNPGVSDGKLNNWWPYIFDFNRFNGSAIDFVVEGFPVIPGVFPPVVDEYGTDENSAEHWGYWHSQNGFSPGGKAAELNIVSKLVNPDYVKAGKYALKVYIENAQYWESWGFGRNDVFFPASRDAHWKKPNLTEVRFSIKPEENANLLVGTNPIVRLYKNGSSRIEFVPLDRGFYANLLRNDALRDSDGWYNFSIPLTGDASWEKNVIGYVDPTLTELGKQAAIVQIEKDILADLNYVEISIRSTTTRQDAPYDTVSYYIDNLLLVDRGRIINDLVYFSPMLETFRTTSDTTRCPAGFVGEFSFAAALKNISDKSLSDLKVQVKSLTNGNLLQNADGGAGGSGAILTVPRVGNYGDGMLEQNADPVIVPFTICLTSQRSFLFYVNVLGTTQ